MIKISVLGVIGIVLVLISYVLISNENVLNNVYTIDITKNKFSNKIEVVENELFIQNITGNKYFVRFIETFIPLSNKVICINKITKKEFEYLESNKENINLKIEDYVCKFDKVKFYTGSKEELRYFIDK